MGKAALVGRPASSRTGSSGRRRAHRRSPGWRSSPSPAWRRCRSARPCRGPRRPWPTRSRCRRAGPLTSWSWGRKA